MKRGSVWWADLGQNTGHIQGGVRPVIILGNWKALKYGTTITVIPVTLQIKRLDMKTHVHGFNTHLGRPCMALCEQIMTIDRGKLLGPMSDIEFNIDDIDKAIKGGLGIEI